MNQQIEEVKFHKKIRGRKKDWEKADCNLELSQSVGIKENELRFEVGQSLVHCVYP